MAGAVRSAAPPIYVPPTLTVRPRQLALAMEQKQHLAGRTRCVARVMPAWRGRLLPERPLALALTAILWHLLDLTWVYLYLVLLFYGR